METKKEYNRKRKIQRRIWISRVFANTGGADPEELYKEALRKFNKDYPKYEHR